MNTYLKLTAGLFLFVACSPMQKANKMANKNKINAIYPTATFDSIAAKKALAYGNITIEGIAYTKPRNQIGTKVPLSKRIFAANTTVVLFPVTSYLEEWFHLRNEKESKRTHVYMSNDAFKYRIVEKTDEYGRFKFEKMKPGRYFIQCIMGYSETKSRQVYQGTAYGTYSTADYYSKQYYNVAKYERLEEFITVKEGDTKLEIKLK
ncbi:hypothetical protein KJS94_01710 [Flavihumibacter rivuli]|uniref:hypothetical protein n=1 Tax=Flavihumibacter rivuli TaxID=2838156 RepID=UPI001BDE2DF0|nr:hypothetical protein [Flavihumibacter rivuli]ULQ56913.1 hypothetical protein KJS94_01710 [Flavihumibacter rivuli]